jgi:hypothetical protein
MSLVHSASLISFKVGVGIRWCLGIGPKGEGLRKSRLSVEFKMLAPGYGLGLQI